MAAGALGRVAACCPAAVGPTFLEPLLQLQALLQEASPDDLTAPKAQAIMHSILLRWAVGQSRLAACLASSGLLEEARQLAEQLRAAGDQRHALRIMEALPPAAVLLQQAAAEASTVLQLLPPSSQAGTEGSSSSGAAAAAAAAAAAEQAAACELAGLLSTAQQSLAAQLVAVLAAEHAELADALQALLPAASHAAQLLWRFWAQPETMAAANLQRATAATVRSCAHLRCPNLAFAGGPAAGKGQGSKRCSACRTAWYCSTGCSRADWKAARHKCACASLAAAALCDS